MAVRLLRAAVIALVIVLAGSTAAAHAVAPPQFVTAQWLVRVPTAVPAGFVARASDPEGDAVALARAAAILRLVRDGAVAASLDCAPGAPCAGRLAPARQAPVRIARTLATV
jgi:hypothetical protein